MTIIINSEVVYVPLDATDVHHDTLRTELAQIGPHVVGVSTQGSGGHFAHVQTMVTPELDIAITLALEGYEGRQYPDGTDVRLEILHNLQAKYPQVTDLAFMHDNAYVTVRGDIPDGTHAAIADVAAKHDPTPPPAEPTDKERIAELERQIKLLLAAKK